VWFGGGARDPRVGHLRYQRQLPESPHLFPFL
jgi:hypothetical protein